MSPFDKNDSSSSPQQQDRPERGERPARSEQGSRPERGGDAGRPGRPDLLARGDRFDRGERPARAPRPERGLSEDRGPRPDRGDRPARGERPDRGDRPARGDRPDRGDRGDRPSRGERGVESITEIDRDIVRLIARRTHLRNDLPQGRNAARQERELRAAWEENVARVSRDPRLARQVFALLQQVECLPRRSGNAPVQEAFNLNPSKSPVNREITGISDFRRTLFLGTMAAATGSPLVLTDVMINDPLVELVKAVNQMNPCLRWEEDGRLMCVPEKRTLGTDKGLLDRAVHVGDAMLNFLLVLGVMAARPCRLKIMGGSNLKLAALSNLRHFLPSIGARFTSIVPGQEGLPARLEASGILPEQVIIPNTLTHDEVMAVCIGLLCAPRSQSLRIDVSQHAQAESVLSELQDIFQSIHTPLSQEGGVLYLAPNPAPAFSFPEGMKLPVDLGVACIGLAIPFFVGGKVYSNGLWPETAAGEACAKMLEAAGLRFSHSKTGMEASGKPGTVFDNALFAPYEKNLPERIRPIAILLSVTPALRGGKAMLPQCALEEEQVLDDFLSRLNLERDGLAVSVADCGPIADLPWGGPTPLWAAALALAAFVRPNLKLLNPGTVLEHMPRFWVWYNNLATPQQPVAEVAEAVRAEKPVADENPETAPRRRIRASFMPKDQMPPPLALVEDE